MRFRKFENLCTIFYYVHQDTVYLIGNNISEEPVPSVFGAWCSMDFCRV
jgi:hypothetical protein